MVVVVVVVVVIIVVVFVVIYTKFWQLSPQGLIRLSQPTPLNLCITA